jgi:hypothetical protein
MRSSVVLAQLKTQKGDGKDSRLFRIMWRDIARGKNITYVSL